jgi:hypothetical protein
MQSHVVDYDHQLQQRWGIYHTPATSEMCPTEIIDANFCQVVDYTYYMIDLRLLSLVRLGCVL